MGGWAGKESKVSRPIIGGGGFGRLYQFYHWLGGLPFGRSFIKIIKINANSHSRQLTNDHFVRGKARGTAQSPAFVDGLEEKPDKS